MEVHNVLGNGFQEKIYQRALRYEMEKAGLKFAEEFWMPIKYKEIELGTRRVDFFVEEQSQRRTKSRFRTGECAHRTGNELHGSNLQGLKGSKDHVYHRSSQTSLPSQYIVSFIEKTGIIQG